MSIPFLNIGHIRRKQIDSQQSLGDQFAYAGMRLPVIRCAFHVPPKILLLTGIEIQKPRSGRISVHAYSLTFIVLNRNPSQSASY